MGSAYINHRRWIELGSRWDLQLQPREYDFWRHVINRTHCVRTRWCVSNLHADGNGKDGTQVIVILEEKGWARSAHPFFVHKMSMLHYSHDHRKNTRRTNRRTHP